MAFICVLLLSGSLVALRCELVRRWLCFAGMVLGACAALGVVGITATVPALYPLWFVGMFGLYLSLLVLGVSCVIRWRRLAPR